jgi:hypothetical protein
MATVVECLASLAEIAKQKGFKTCLVPVKEEAKFSDESLRKKISEEEMFEFKQQLVKVKVSFPLSFFVEFTRIRPLKKTKLKLHQ